MSDVPLRKLPVSDTRSRKDLILNAIQAEYDVALTRLCPCSNYSEKDLLYNLVLAIQAGGGGGGGTVTSFSFTNANGISGVVLNPTTTPALTLSLGAITPTSVNGLTITPTTGTLTVPNGVTLAPNTVGAAFINLADPSAITFPRVNADNSVSLLDAATFRTAIGAGTGNGDMLAATYDPAGGAVQVAFRPIANIFSANGALSAPAMTLSGTWITGGTATTTKPQLLVEPGGTTSNAWSTSGTGLGINAAAGFAGNLIDCKVGSARRFEIGQVGQLFCNGTATLANSSMTVQDAENSAVLFNSYSFTWTTTNAPRLYGSVADTMQVRNSTRAQVFQVYRTFTDTSNYERMGLQSGAGYFEVACETAGSGTDNIDLRLTPVGTGLVQINTAVAVGVAVASTHTINIKASDGNTYKVLLSNV